MGTLVIQIKKGKDSRPTLTCIRPDGTRTWRTAHPFFPIHDLTHYAVESTLAYTEAFFGLIASGWNIDTFEAPGKAREMPAQALWAERIVGLLDVERGSGVLHGPAEFNAWLAHDHEGHPPVPPLTGDQLFRIRALRSALTARWQAIAPGDTLELEWAFAPPA